LTIPPAIVYDAAMTDTLRTQLDLQMDELRTRVIRPTALFDVLIQWGESAIREQGPKSLNEVTAACSLWWTAHRPARTGPALDAWFELQVAIESLLLSCLMSSYDGGQHDEL
jgi:hypothetical protein